MIWLAQVDLDLALLHCDRGEWSRVLDLASEAVPLLEPLRLGRETLNAVGLLAEAVKGEEISQELLRKVKRCLELERSDPNRTLRRRLGEATLPDALRDRFLALLDRLEGCWFRDRVADQELYTDWCALHSEIVTLPEGA